MPTPDDEKDLIAAGARRPYATPEVSWEEAFEVQANLASACDKMASDGGQCAINSGS